MATLFYFRQTLYIVIGYVHATGISYFSVYDYNLAMVSVQGMIDIGEFERVELDNFDSFVTDCLYVFLFQWLVVWQIAEGIKQSSDFHSFFHFFRTSVQWPKRDSLKNTNTLMTNTMIAIFAQTIKFWNIVQPIVMDIVNIKAVEMYAKIVHIYLNVQKAKIMWNW